MEEQVPFGGREGVRFVVPKKVGHSSWRSSLALINVPMVLGAFKGDWLVEVKVEGDESRFQMRRGCRLIKV